MKPRCKIFIGSSGEALELAREVQKSLSFEHDPIVWTDSLFQVNESTFAALNAFCGEFDFAIFILSADDQVESRNRKQVAPRDNVIFEFGLFMGALGSERAFAIRTDQKDLKTMSDIAGITIPTLRTTERADEHPRISEATKAGAVAAALHSIRTAIKQLGPQERPPKLRTTAPLSFGSTIALAKLADAAVHLVETRNDLQDELKRRIASGDLVPGKLLYFSDEATQLWKKICAMHEYAFYRTSKEQLDDVAADLVQKAIETTNQEYGFDFISLGVGDGAKDEILLRALLDKSPKGITHYYPIDISESMLVDGIRAATESIHEPDRRRLRVKGVIGDITQLKSFENVYEFRPQHNIFSLLGNTLGNNDEALLVDALKNAMWPGDLALIEVNVSPPSKVSEDPFVQEDINMRHDFSPLASLGLKFVPGAMSYAENNKLSVLGKKTRSVIATCDGARLKTSEKAFKKRIKLSVVHHYDKKEVEESLSKKLRANLVWSKEKAGVALMLFQQKQKAEPG